MKTSALLPTFLTIILCAFAADAAYGKGLPKGKPTPVPAKSSAHSLIVTVSSTGISVKTGHDTKQFKIDSHTIVTLDGNIAAVGALKARHVCGRHPGGIDPSAAASISATTPRKTESVLKKPMEGITPRPEGTKRPC